MALRRTLCAHTSDGTGDSALHETSASYAEAPWLFSRPTACEADWALVYVEWAEALMTDQEAKWKG